MKIVSISPRPNDDEAAAIAVALTRVYAARVEPEVRSGRYGRASLGTPPLDPECKLTWRESARLEALDAGV